MANAKLTEELIKEMLDYADENGTHATTVKYNVSKSTIYYHQKKRDQHERKKLSKVITPRVGKDEVKENPFVSLELATESREYRRGDIYYVHRYDTTGSEIATGRPAIIVSNNRLNTKIETVEVVFLTTKNKRTAPEHFSMKATGILSTTICEQITTVDKARLGDYIGTCTPDEIKLLNKALLSSLGLEQYINQTNDDQIVNRIAEIKAERDAYKTIYNELFDRMMHRKE